MIPKVHLHALLLAAASVLSATAWAQAVRPAPSCSNSTLQGNYGLLVSGTIAGNPIAILGQIVADGHGGLTGMETVSDNGVTLETAEVTGTYRIVPKCAGTATITPKGGTAANYNLTILAGGKVQLVRTDSATVQSGFLQVQGTDPCSYSGVGATYGIRQTGGVVGQGPLVYGGEILLRANGLLSGVRWGSVNGVISSDMISGAYKVDKRCFGGAVLSINQGPQTFYNLVVVRDGVLFLASEPGIVASGAWER